MEKVLAKIDSKFEYVESKIATVFWHLEYLLP